LVPPHSIACILANVDALPFIRSATRPDAFRTE